MPVGEWYRKEAFDKFIASSSLNREFRGGFWYHTVERFFILEQFLQMSSLETAFHIELDVLPINLSGVADELDRKGKGLFYPRETSNKAAASILYINDVSALTALCDYAIESGENLRTDMFILSGFLSDHPRKAFPLDSEIALESHRATTEKKDPNHLPWLFDATGLGLWIFGQDPRNQKGIPRNHTIGANRSRVVASTKFSFNMRKRIVVARQGNRKFEVKTLHVHSKMFTALERPWGLWFALLKANLPFSTPIRLNADILLGWSLNWATRRVPARSFRRITSNALGQRLLRAALARAEWRYSQRQERYFSSALRPAKQNHTRDSKF